MPDIAADGAEALERWRQGAYTLLLTDLHMPRLDGYGLVAAIRAEEARAGHGGHTVIVAITANAMQGEDQRCKAAGMDDYLAKPVGLRRLEAVLGRWLAQASLVPGAARRRRCAGAGRARAAGVRAARDRALRRQPPRGGALLPGQVPDPAPGHGTGNGARPRRGPDRRSRGALAPPEVLVAHGGRAGARRRLRRAGNGLPERCRRRPGVVEMQDATAEAAAALARHLGAAATPPDPPGGGKP